LSSSGIYYYFFVIGKIEVIFSQWFQNKFFFFS